jgi:hypothetical protein
MMIRDTDSLQRDLKIRSGLLTQQYAIDGLVKQHDHRLDFLRKHNQELQSKRRDQFRSVQQAVEDGKSLSDIGR